MNKIVRFFLKSVRLITSKLVALFVSYKNGLYWKHYDRKWMMILESVNNNKLIYSRVFLCTLLNKLVGKKVIVVHITCNSHYYIIKDILLNLIKKDDCKVILFSTEDFEVSNKIKLFNSNDVKLTRGRRFIPSLWADVFLTPTSEVADIMQANCVKVIFMHSLMGIAGIYEEDTFDGYDYVFCSGKHHVEEFSRLYSNKRLRNKCLIPGGYTKLDSQIALADADKADTRSKCVIVAPTLLAKNTEEISFLSHGVEFISKLLSMEFKVILRPHPLNLQRADEYFHVVESLVEKFSKHSSFELDDGKDYSKSYSESSMMISDISGTAYTYAFAYCKPVLFFKPKKTSIFNQGLLFEQRDGLGEEFESESELEKIASEMYLNHHYYESRIADVRSKFIFNVGSAADYFSDNLEHIITGRKNNEWKYL